MKRVVLAQPRGFCAGVERAIEIVERAIKLHGSPIYVRHEIVHNAYVVEDLRKKGAIFIERLEEVPAGNTVIFSAHGVSKAVRSEAESRGLRVRLRLGQLPPEDSSPGLSPCQVCLAGEASLRQTLDASKNALGVPQVGGDRPGGGFGCGGPRFRKGEVGFRKRAVELRQHLALFDNDAFVDEQLSHLAGDLGRHCGLPPRHHVAGGRETAGLRRP